MAGPAPVPNRVGLIVPSSNVVVEETIQSAPQPGVVCHVARLSVVAVDLDVGSRAQFDDDPRDRAVRSLREAEVNRMVFAGTAGAWLGIAEERDWCARMADRHGIEVTSTTLICLDRLRDLACPVALVTPFLPDVHAAIRVNFASEGVDTLEGQAFGLTSSREMADVAPDRIADRIDTCIAHGAEAVLCFCTNFRGQAAFPLVAGRSPRPLLLDSVTLSLAQPVAD